MKKVLIAAFWAAAAFSSLPAAAAGSNQENATAIGVPEVGITNMGDDMGTNETVKERAAEASISGMESDAGSGTSQYPTQNAQTRTGEQAQDNHAADKQGSQPGQGGTQPSEQSNASGADDISTHGTIPNEHTNSNR